MPQSILVIGAGQAAQSLVETLRAEGYDGALTLVGEEPRPPYQRPPLSKKYLLGELDAARLAFRPESWFAENSVTTRWGVSVDAIDRVGRTAALSTGETLAYDRLALTTGARPRRLPAAIGGALANVHVVRNLSDIDLLAPEIAPDRRLLVVGGGYIGLEAAAVATQKGMSVTLIEASPRILARVAPKETARHIADLHRHHGVDLRCGATLDRLEDDGMGRATHAVLAEGERIPVDVVIAGIGALPNQELGEKAGLAIENGIAVDAWGRSSDPAIVAAGDCASFPYRGRRIRLESVQNAIDQAKTAARAILGQTDAPYAPTPWFWSDQYDVKLQIAGLSDDANHVVERPGDKPGAYSIWSFAGDRFVAVDALNDPRAFMTGKRWLEKGESPNPGAIADPQVPLKDATGPA